MMTRCLFCVLVLMPILVACGCDRAADAGPAAAAPPRVAEPSPRVVDHFGRATWQVIQHAERVEVYRLDPRRGADEGEEPEATLGRWPIVRTVRPSQAWIDRFRSVLADASSYDWEGGKGCIPMAGVGVRFVRGEDRVDVWLCYRCQMLGMQRLTGAATQPAAEAGEDFDPAADALIALAKEAFPDDPAIQALPETEGPL